MLRLVMRSLMRRGYRLVCCPTFAWGVVPVRFRVRAPGTTADEVRMLADKERKLGPQRALTGSRLNGRQCDSGGNILAFDPKRVMPSTVPAYGEYEFAGRPPV